MPRKGEDGPDESVEWADDSSANSAVVEGLNPSQRESVLRPRYSITRVIAGPGAGKTRVLTCRIARLLLDDDDDGDGGEASDHPNDPSGGEDEGRGRQSASNLRQPKHTETCA